MPMNENQQALCESHDFDCSDLSAVFLNCTLKPSGTLSHTAALIDVSCAIMQANGIPAHGNQRGAWDAGCRFDHPNPGYRRTARVA